jgi:flagellar protein FliO/FliZ
VIDARRLRTQTFGAALAAAGALLAAAAQAAAPAAAAPSATAGLLQVLISLVFILAVIVALAWLATRLRLTPRTASTALKVLADVPVGQKERVVLVKVGDAQALVGVGADGVRSLQLLERSVEIPADEAPGAFADRLKQMMTKGNVR